MLSSGAAEESRGLWSRGRLLPLETWGLEGEELSMGGKGRSQAKSWTQAGRAAHGVGKRTGPR